MRIGWVLGVLALAGCAAPEGDERAARGSFAATCADGQTVEGADISHYQANTDWAEVKDSGRVFGIVKATEGTTFIDSEFATNWSAMKELGVIRGAYHFFHPASDPIAQADHFTEIMGPLASGDLPAALDLEDDDDEDAETIAAAALAFLQRLEENTGKRPLLYTGNNFFKNVMDSPLGFEDYPLWIPIWGPTCPTIPDAFPRWAIWQYTATGSIPGVPGANVDHDVFNGSLEDLEAFVFTAPPEVPLAQLAGNAAFAVVEEAGTTKVFATTESGELVASEAKGSASFGAPAGITDGARCGIAALRWGAPFEYAEAFSPTDEGPVQNLADGDAGWEPSDGNGGEGLTQLSTLRWLDGHAEAFGLGSDGALYRNVKRLGSAAWSGWTTLGGSFATGAAGILWDDGHAEIFATDVEGRAWHTWSGAFPGGYHAWALLGGALTSRPVPVRWPDGHLEVFARGIDGRLQHSEYRSGSGWSAFAAVDPETPIWGEPAVTIAGAGKAARPEVFARDEAGRLMQLAHDGSRYGRFERLDGEPIASDPFAWSRPDGATDVFGVDAEGKLLVSRRIPGGAFQPWTAIAEGPFSACATPVPGEGGGGATGGGAGGGEPHEASGPPGESGGCACRSQAPSTAREGHAWLVLGLGLLVTRRRRSGR